MLLGPEMTVVDDAAVAAAADDDDDGGRSSFGGGNELDGSRIDVHYLRIEYKMKQNGRQSEI